MGRSPLFRNRRSTIGSMTLLILLVVACSEASNPAEARFVADLESRCARLQPLIEREIGRELGDVEWVVLPPSDWKKDEIASHRSRLARIDNGPRGEDLDAEARSITDDLAHPFFESATVRVDSRGRVLFSVSGGKDPSEVVRAIGLGRKKADPGALDLFVLHQLVHVHQFRHLGAEAFIDSAQSRADLLARRAVLEGHAEFLTRKIAKTLGLEVLYKSSVEHRSLTIAGGPPGLFITELASPDSNLMYAPNQGLIFVDSVVMKLGYATAIKRMFASPPSLDVVSRPNRFSRPSSARSPSMGPLFEDLRRWLDRERGETSIVPIALPDVIEWVGAPSDAFDQGVDLATARSEIKLQVVVATDPSSARRLLLAWTRWLEVLRERDVAALPFLMTEVARTTEADRWTLHLFGGEYFGHVRRMVARKGRFIVYIRVRHDSKIERGAERLAERALRFLTDSAWRKAWLDGDPVLR